MREIRLGAAVRWILMAAALWTGAPVAAQDLADFDYENLSWRGLGVEWGYLYPTRVEETQSIALRFDMGYLGPGLRIVPSATFWSSPLKDVEVAELEGSLARLIADQIAGPPPPVDLGEITWSDVAVSVDAQVVWRVPFGVLTYAGLGGTIHILNGSGAAIEGTFVEDLLDSVTPGGNVHLGLEYPFHERLRLQGQGRYEVLGDLQYLQLGFGLQLMIGEPHPGEVGGP
jgi:hypothetical protein